MESSDLVIRFAGADDLKLLVTLGMTTCYEAYFELDPSKDLAEYCVRSFSEKQLKEEFEDKSSTFLIAEINARAVGYAKLREGKRIECMAGKNAVEIQRIYILERFKGKRIGERLINRCFEIAEERNFETVWLGVWDKNTAAQKFYEKIGMTRVGWTDFSDGKTEFINMVFAKDIL